MNIQEKISRFKELQAEIMKQDFLELWNVNIITL